MSTPNGNGSRSRPPTPYGAHNRRRKRRRGRTRRRRRLGVVFFVLLVILAVLGSVGFSNARDIQRDCDLNDLRPASIGSNSFIYAADGSLLGSSRRRRTASR